MNDSSVQDIASDSEDSINNQEIMFTRSAALKVQSLIDEEGDDQLKLRVFISGGGCSGFQYGFTFDDQVAKDDHIIEHDLADDEDEGGEGGADQSGIVTLLVDPLSFQYLQGAEIDYREDVHGAQFVIKNPNANTTCGCGNSFSV